MKVDFALPTDGKMHRFCFACHQEDVDQVQVDGRTRYKCNVCHKTSGRAIYFNKHKFWIDEDNELWHESAGIFVRNNENKYLFFKRTEYPIALTLPAGHVDSGEDPESAAKRELEEEVGLRADEIVHLGTREFKGDSCSSGADNHRWHAFFVEIPQDQEIRVKEEGEKPVWLTIEEAKGDNLAYVIEKAIQEYEDKLKDI